MTSTTATATAAAAPGSSFMRMLIKRLADETFVNDGLVDLLELLHDTDAQLTVERKQVNEAFWIFENCVFFVTRRFLFCC